MRANKFYNLTIVECEFKLWCAIFIKYNISSKVSKGCLKILGRNRRIEFEFEIIRRKQMQNK